MCGKGQTQINDSAARVIKETQERATSTSSDRAGGQQGWHCSVPQPGFDRAADGWEPLKLQRMDLSSSGWHPRAAVCSQSGRRSAVCQLQQTGSPHPAEPCSKEDIDSLFPVKTPSRVAVNCTSMDLSCLLKLESDKPFFWWWCWLKFVPTSLSPTLVTPSCSGAGAAHTLGQLRTQHPNWLSWCAVGWASPLWGCELALEQPEDAHVHRQAPSVERQKEFGSFILHGGGK